MVIEGVSTKDRLVDEIRLRRSRCRSWPTADADRWRQRCAAPALRPRNIASLRRWWRAPAWRPPAPSGPNVEEGPAPRTTAGLGSQIARPTRLVRRRLIRIGQLCQIESLDAGNGHSLAAPGNQPAAWPKGSSDPWRDIDASSTVSRATATGRASRAVSLEW